MWTETPGVATMTGLSEFRNSVNAGISGMLLRARRAFVELLTFLRVVDAHDRTVSLTSVTLMVAVAKLATMDKPDMEHLGILIAGLAAYELKRRAKVSSVVSEERIGALETATKAIGALEAGAKATAEKLAHVDNRVKAREAQGGPGGYR